MKPQTILSSLWQNFCRLDFVLLFIVYSLLFTGAYFIYGIGQQIDILEEFARKQIIWILLGTIVMFVVAFVDYEILGKFSWAIYLGGLFLLALVLIIGIETNGAKSWLRFPGFTVQPSELAKPAAIVALARLATRQRVHLNQISHVLPIVALAIPPMLLIGLQPDFGSALVFIPVTAAVLFFSGIKKRFLIYPILLCVILTPFLYSQLRLHQKQRINVFLHPIVHPVSVKYSQNLAQEQGLPQERIDQIEKMRDPYFFTKTEIAYKSKELNKIEYQKIAQPFSLFKKGEITRKEYEHLKRRGYVTIKEFIHNEAWQSHQATLAVGSGGATGKGFMKGQQHTLGFLPSKVSPTDCIFSVIGEEMGFYRSSLLILMLFGLILAVIRVAYLARDAFGRVIGLAIATMFLTHLYINIGMAMGIAPVIGIPLPFVSYGGSFVLSSMISIGLLQNIYIRRKRDHLGEKLADI